MHRFPRHSFFSIKDVGRRHAFFAPFVRTPIAYAQKSMKSIQLIKEYVVKEFVPVWLQSVHELPTCYGTVDIRQSWKSYYETDPNDNGFLYYFIDQIRHV